jgi:RNA 3'-terminal phosphate cyclase (ATP)
MALEIDGSYGEGGGQILRTTLALSSITGKSIHIKNIRKGRKKPGLLQQHLTCIKAARQATDAKVEGATFRSEELYFEPQSPKAGSYYFDVAEERGSAGATSLVLQAIMPILVYAPGSSTVRIKGGTHTEWSPPFHYLQEVLAPMLSKLGIEISLSLKRWGFYPRGGGEVEVRIKSCKDMRGVHITNAGTLKSIRGMSIVSALPISIAERQKLQAISRLKDFSPQIEVVKVSAQSPGTFFFIIGNFENMRTGFSSLGKLGKPAEKVADEACDEFLNHYKSKKALDKYLADQIILYLALAKAKSMFTTSCVSQHLLTNIWVIKKFLNRSITIKGTLGETGEVEID